MTEWVPPDDRRDDDENAGLDRFEEPTKKLIRLEPPDGDTNPRFAVFFHAPETLFTAQSSDDRLLFSIDAKLEVKPADPEHLQLQ